MRYCAGLPGFQNVDLTISGKNSYKFVQSPPYAFYCIFINKYFQNSKKSHEIFFLLIHSNFTSLSTKFCFKAQEQPERQLCYVWKGWSPTGLGQKQNEKKVKSKVTLGQNQEFLQIQYIHFSNSYNFFL